MADKEITIKVSTEADTQEVDDLKTLLEQIQSPNITVETDVDSAITDIESLQTEFEEATATVDELTQELANIELGVSDGDFDEVSLQLEEASQRADELGEALSNMDTAGLNDASSGADELNSSLQNASGSAEELSNSMGLIESSMLMDMANQVGTLGDQAENTALDLENTAISMSQLSTNTGIADGELRNMISYISNETFPQSEAIAYANALNQMGVEASKLGDSATNMDRINDATGIGYSKVIQLTQGLRGLGVSADNLPSSFNAIAYAQANVTGGADTLSMVLKTQAGTLNEYGINVDQLVVILGRLSEKGYSGRKMGAELSKILKENNGDVQALEQSLGLQAGALSNASAKTGEYDGKLMDLANAEMENKTITERLGAVWEDLSLQLEPVLSPLMSFMGLVGSIGQGALAINSILTLAETFGILKTATISETIAQWGLNASMLANPVLWLVVAIIVLIGVLIWAYYNCEDFRNAVNSLGEGLLWLGQVIYSSLVGTFEWLMSLFTDFTEQLGLDSNNWIEAVLGFILFLPQLPMRVGQLLLDTLMKALGFGDDFTNTMIQGAIDTVNGFISWIGQMYDKLCEEFDKMLDRAGQFALEIADKLSFGGASMVYGWITGSGEHSPGYMYDALLGELLAMIGLPEETLGELVDWISEYGYQMADALSQALLGISFDEVIGNVLWLLSSLQGLQDWIFTAGGLIPANVDMTGNSVIDTILRVIGFVATLPIQLWIIFLDIIGKTLGFGNNFGQTIKNAGLNAVNNFTSSISNLGGALFDELNGMLSDAQNFVGQIGQILWEAGVNAINNFLNGLQRHSPGKMQREFRAELTEMVDFVPYASDRLSGNIKKLSQNMVGSFSGFDFNSSDIEFNGTANGNDRLSELIDTLMRLLPVIANNNPTVNIYGDVDNEERANKIVDIIRKELNWDNTTAGRTV